MRHSHDAPTAARQLELKQYEVVRIKLRGSKRMSRRDLRPSGSGANGSSGSGERSPQPRDPQRSHGRGVGKEARAPGGQSGRTRNFYSVEFKRRVVEAALARHPDDRIHPTCAQFPTVVPCQLRKWIKAYEDAHPPPAGPPAGVSGPPTAVAMGLPFMALPPPTALAAPAALALAGLYGKVASSGPPLPLLPFAPDPLGLIGPFTQHTPCTLLTNPKG